MKSLIQFYHLPKGLDKELLKSVIVYFVESYNATLKQLAFNFVSGEELLSLNRKHLEHDYETDILTFDYGTLTEIEAEIYISSKALSEAPQRFNQSPENEAIRLIAHGLFHCLGQKDTTTTEKKKMNSLEEAFINTFHVKQRAHV